MRVKVPKSWKVKLDGKKKQNKTNRLERSLGSYRRCLRRYRGTAAAAAVGVTDENKNNYNNDYFNNNNKIR